MKTLRGYFAREVLAAVAFVLAGFLALFTFFDFISELEDIGRGGYQFQHALAYVTLSLPSHIYELMPVATLIGTIYALAQFASNSEFTAMRAAGLSRPKAISALLRVGIILSVLTAIFGEGIAPPADRLAQDIRLGAMGGKVTGQFRSGIWLRDTVRDEAGKTSRQRFVNVAHLSPTGSLRGVRIFEFDTEMRLRSVIAAPNGAFTGIDRWDLNEVYELAIKPAEGDPSTAIRVKRSWLGDHEWTSELTPELISVIAVAPDRMSAFDLYRYVTHLRQNRQDSTRYELALWKKAVYPIAILVMIALALPFAYMHARAGSIGYKVFAGIMVGVGFHFLKRTFLSYRSVKYLAAVGVGQYSQHRGASDRSLYAVARGWCPLGKVVVVGCLPTLKCVALQRTVRVLTQWRLSGSARRVATLGKEKGATKSAFKMAAELPLLLLDSQWAG